MAIVYHITPDSACKFGYRWSKDSYGKDSLPGQSCTQAPLVQTTGCNPTNKMVAGHCVAVDEPAILDFGGPEPLQILLSPPTCPAGQVAVKKANNQYVCEQVNTRPCPPGQSKNSHGKCVPNYMVKGAVTSRPRVFAGMANRMPNAAPAQGGFPSPGQVNENCPAGYHYMAGQCYPNANAVAGEEDNLGAPAHTAVTASAHIASVKQDVFVANISEKNGVQRCYLVSKSGNDAALRSACKVVGAFPPNIITLPSGRKAGLLIDWNAYGSAQLAAESLLCNKAVQTYGFGQLSKSDLDVINNIMYGGQAKGVFHPQSGTEDNLGAPAYTTHGPAPQKGGIFVFSDGRGCWLINETGNPRAMESAFRTILSAGGNVVNTTSGGKHDKAVYLGTCSSSAAMSAVKVYGYGVASAVSRAAMNQYILPDSIKSKIDLSRYASLSAPSDVGIPGGGHGGHGGGFHGGGHGGFHGRGFGHGGFGFFRGTRFVRPDFWGDIGWVNMPNYCVIVGSQLDWVQTGASHFVNMHPGATYTITDFGNGRVGAVFPQIYCTSLRNFFGPWTISNMVSGQLGGSDTHHLIVFDPMAGARIIHDHPHFGWTTICVIEADYDFHLVGSEHPLGAADAHSIVGMPGYWSLAGHNVSRCAAYPNDIALPLAAAVMNGDLAGAKQVADDSHKWVQNVPSPKGTIHAPPVQPVNNTFVEHGIVKNPKCPSGHSDKYGNCTENLRSLPVPYRAAR